MRGSYGYNRTSTLPSSPEKIIAVLSYLTAGMVGFIWLILSHVTGKSLKPFLRYHVMQSIFISVIYFLAKIIVGIMLAFLKVIPFIGSLVLALVFYTAHMPLLFGFSILHFGILLVIAYLVVTSFMGQYSFLPWVSDNIRRMI